jgi:hypothetical protein
MSFTFQSLNRSDPYYSNWVKYRRLNRIVLGAIVGWLSAGLLLAFLTLTIFGAYYLLCWAVPLMLVIALAYHELLLWPCPRCGKSFYWVVVVSCFYPFAWPVARRCLYCGLRKYAPDSLNAERQN